MTVHPAAHVGATTETPFHWDVVNVRAMGRYLTSVEGAFLDQLFTSLPRPQTVLDIGGGSGRFAIPLHAAGHRVLLVDAGMTPLRALARRAPGVGRALVSGKLGELPVAEGSVDCVVCIEVPVVDEPEPFFAECRRVLRPGGLVVFTTLNRCSYKGLLKRLAKRGSGRTHYGEIYRHTIAEIRAYLGAAGLTVLREHGFNWIPATRESDSRLVRPAALLERRLGLGRLVDLSPWVLVAARQAGSR